MSHISAKTSKFSQSTELRNVAAKIYVQVSVELKERLVRGIIDRVSLLQSVVEIVCLGL